MGSRHVIHRLPGSVVSHLRSGTVLSSVAQIAEELVCNSLDAGAANIEIAVDGEASHIRVDDDGCGISRDDLTFVGERHATSKLHSLYELEEGVSTLGFRGEALSSLCDLALVEITSRCRGMPNTYRKILKGSATISIGLCGEQRTFGTTVVAKDMFYNQPVRRRLLHSNHKKTLQAVKECVLRLVLVHPQVSFSVKDPARKEVLLQSKRGATLTGTLRDMFGEDVISKLREIDYVQGHLRLSGYLSTIYYSHSSKALQYFYINRRYVEKTALHKLLNSWSGLYSDSGNFEGSVGQTKCKAERRSNVEMGTEKHSFPAFVLNMTCPSSEYDVSFEASKTLIEFKDWSPVASFVQSVLKEVWGNQSTGKGDIFQAFDPFSQSTLKNTTSGNGLQQEDTRRIARKGIEFPSMSVRRAIVQSDYGASRPSSNMLRSRENAKETAVSIPTSAWLPSAGQLGERSFDPLSSLGMLTKDPSKPTKISRMDYSRQGYLTSSPGNWVMKTCKQKRRSDQELSSKSLQRSGDDTKCSKLEGTEPVDRFGAEVNSFKSSFRGTIDDWDIPENQASDLRTPKGYGCGIELDSCWPRSRRRLYDSFENDSDNLGSGADQFSQPMPGAVDSSPFRSPFLLMRSQRGHSAPPFYRPPGRHGAHANPMESLSTLIRTRSATQDSENMQTDLRIVLEGPQREPLTRGKPEMEDGEVVVVQQEEPGPAIVCGSSIDDNTMCKYRASTDPLDALACPNAVPDADFLGECKYRSAGVSTPMQEVAELPGDTARAIFREWSNPCMRKNDDILDLSLGILGTNSSSLLPRTITKDILQHARVLQQVDAKFIAAVSFGVLLLIDQHAADERVRLEELREDVLEEHAVKQSSLLSGAEDLMLTFTEQQALQTYYQQIQDWGWRFKVPTGRRTEGRTKGMCKVLVSAVPSILDVSLTAADLAEYLRQLNDTQGSSAAPPAIIRLLNYKACRGAIMFGDVLLPAECSQLIEHLKRTRLCFQCAHGRPTMVPLVDLQALHRRFEHGISRGPSASDWVAGAGAPKLRENRHRSHVSARPSLQRAQERLRQAEGP